MARHFTRIIALASAATIATLAATAGTSYAAKTAPTYTITLNESTPHLGGTVTFTTTGVDKIKSPRIAVRCFQGTAMGYAEAGPADQAFLLGGAWSLWLTAGGPASCTAELFYIVWSPNSPQVFVTLATTSFNAAG